MPLSLFCNATPLRKYLPNWKSILIPQLLILGAFLLTSFKPQLSNLALFSTDFWFGLTNSGIGWPMLSLATLTFSAGREVHKVKKGLLEQACRLDADFDSGELTKAIKEFNDFLRKLANVAGLLTAMPPLALAVGSLVCVMALNPNDLEGFTFKVELFMAWAVGLWAWIDLIEAQFSLNCSDLPYTAVWANKVVTLETEGRLHHDEVARILAEQCLRIVRNCLPKQEAQLPEQALLSEQVKALWLKQNPCERID